MEILIRQAAISSVDDIRPDSRPLEVVEGDRFLHVRRPDGSRTMTQRRVRIVTFVNSVDANKTFTALRDMGPPTGEQEVFIPCHGEVEMAQVHELLDAAIERRRERAARRLMLLPEKNKAFHAAMIDCAEDNILRLRGASTFGPGGHTVRESHGSG